MHVLVAGCGWLGRAVAGELLRRGDRVTAAVRSQEGAARVPPGARPLVLDLADPRAAGALPADLEAIVSTVAARAEGAAAYREAYLDVNRTLLAAAAARPVRGFAYTSSTGVFGQSDGSTVDEATPPAPAGPAGQVLLEVEALVRAAPLARSCVVRLSGLYGPGRAGLLERVRTGRLALGPGDGAWMNFCHREDAAAATLAALDRGRPGAVYHASDARPARREEVVRWVAAFLGIEPPRGGGAPGAARADRRVSGEATRRELGLDLRYPDLRAGLPTLVD